MIADIKLDRLRDKQIQLKPTFVEPSRSIPHRTTHPTLIVTAAEVFRRYGAKGHVGEARGHLRDTAVALQESGGSAREHARFDCTDLNFEPLIRKRNLAQCSSLRGCYLPQSVHEAKLVVSMAKLKTHH